MRVPFDYCQTISWPKRPWRKGSEGDYFTSWVRRRLLTPPESKPRKYCTSTAIVYEHKLCWCHSTNQRPWLVRRGEGQNDLSRLSRLIPPGRLQVLSQRLAISQPWRLQCNASSTNFNISSPCFPYFLRSPSRSRMHISLLQSSRSTFRFYWPHTSATSLHRALVSFLLHHATFIALSSRLATISSLTRSWVCFQAHQAKCI